MTDIFWMMAVSLGPLLLAAAIAYALLRRRRLSPQERHEQRAGTERAYRDEPPPKASEAMPRDTKRDKASRPGERIQQR